MHSTGVNIVLEFRFYMDETGMVYTDASFDNGFWQRYLMVFSHVNIIARAKPVRNNEVQPKWKRVTGDKVSFSAIPYYHGMGDLIRRTPKVIKEIIKIVAANNDPYIYRMPSFIGALFFMVDKDRGKKPYGVEMVGDPEEVFGSLSPLYKPVGRAFVKNTRKIISRAKAVAYVERNILPARYPATNPDNVFYFSSINLPDDSIAASPREFSPGDELRIISIGALDQMYKGPDILLNAIAICKQKNMKLTWIGGGIYLEKMRALAEKLGLQDQVTFTGMITERSKIEDAMDEADVFVLASRTEGLPRAMIEAMARGLPCIGSNVGGIPQLLEDKYLFTKEDPMELAQSLIAMRIYKKVLTEMSAANIETAKQYVNSKLDKERTGFYNAVLNGN